VCFRELVATSNGMSHVVTSYIRFSKGGRFTVLSVTYIFYENFNKLDKEFMPRVSNKFGFDCLRTGTGGGLL
jgi:hypothetical protein